MLRKLNLKKNHGRFERLFSIFWGLFFFIPAQFDSSVLLRKKIVSISQAGLGNALEFCVGLVCAWGGHR